MCLRVRRLDEERMTREGAEIRLRLQEDQLAELQEELRRVSENSPRSDSLQMVLTFCTIAHRANTLICLAAYL